MELEGIYKHVDSETCIKCNERELDRDEDIDANKDQNLSQTEARAQNQRGIKCVVLSTVCFGLMCILLVAAVIVLYIKLTAEREIQATLMLQTGSSNQNEKDQLQNSFNSLSQKKLELETRVKDLTAEKSQLQGSVDDLNKKKQELERKVTSLSEELKREKSKQGNLSGPVCLFKSNELKSWSESRQYCRNHGGDLVIIDTEEKQKSISSFIKERVWIGLSKIENKGNMKWVDNSTLKDGFWYEQRNNAGGNEDCVELMPLDTIQNWNDLPCSEKRKGICEK